MKSGQSLLVAAGVMAATAPQAAELSIKLTLPEIAAQGPRPANRPYVAIWLRKEDNSFAQDLAVWYQVEAKGRRGGPGFGPGAMPGGGAPGGEGAGGMAPPGGMRGMPPGGMPQGGMPPGGMGPGRAMENPKTPGGARWLNEVRQWWADSGNRLQFPVDGLTSASRAAGTYDLTFAGSDPKLANLPPGKYKLVVEAAREHGGEETLSIPFTWPGTAAQNGKAQGKSELGAIELNVKP
jgi:hypothetical protein